MPEAILKIEHLNVCYGNFTAVQDASLEVPYGKIVSLVGGNGAGKTTLMNTVAGLLKPTAGTVVFDGHPITALTADKIVRLGLSLVPQGGRCFPRLSVQDNLLMGSYPVAARKCAKQTLNYVYDLFPDLQKKRNEAAGTLSGGQRQMVAIGRALLSRPKCLIFDEISLGLAPAVIKDIYQSIKRINAEEGTGILLIEQDTQRTLAVSETFYVMRQGKVVSSGKSAEVNIETIKKEYFGI